MMNGAGSAPSDTIASERKYGEVKAFWTRGVWLVADDGSEAYLPYDEAPPDVLPQSVGHRCSWVSEYRRYHVMPIATQFRLEARCGVLRGGSHPAAEVAVEAKCQDSTAYLVMAATGEKERYPNAFGALLAQLNEIAKVRSAHDVFRELEDLGMEISNEQRNAFRGELADLSEAMQRALGVLLDATVSATRGR